MEEKLTHSEHTISESFLALSSGEDLEKFCIGENFTDGNFKIYLSKIPDEILYAYNVYQIEGEGRNLFSNISGDEDTIMGLPVLKIKEYLKTQQ